MPPRPPPPAAKLSPDTQRRILVMWFGLVSLGGLVFGLYAERRLFGNDMLAHPLVVFFAVVTAGLLVLRTALARPVPEVIADRMLFIGCVAGLVAFLLGNWVGTHLLMP